MITLFFFEMVSWAVLQWFNSLSPSFCVKMLGLGEGNFFFDYVPLPTFCCWNETRGSLPFICERGKNNEIASVLAMWFFSRSSQPKKDVKLFFCGNPQTLVFVFY